jgi:hypothetical protein
MLTCSICEKPIYGRTNTNTIKRRVNGTTVTEPAPMVCGSCPLNKSQGDPTGKSLSEVRLGLAQVVTKQIPVSQERTMSDLKVKSNVRNKVLLLDGRHAVVFDENGLGKCPAHLRELFDREMMMRPGRFSYVTEAPPVTPVAEVVQVEELAVEEEVVLEVEEVPQELDQSFSTETEKPKKASKKK